MRGRTGRNVATCHYRMLLPTLMLCTNTLGERPWLYFLQRKIGHVARPPGWSTHPPDLHRVAWMPSYWPGTCWMQGPPLPAGFLPSHASALEPVSGAGWGQQGVCPEWASKHQLVAGQLLLVAGAARKLLVLDLTKFPSRWDNKWGRARSKSVFVGCRVESPEGLFWIQH